MNKRYATGFAFLMVLLLSCILFGCGGNGDDEDNGLGIPDPDPVVRTDNDVYVPQQASFQSPPGDIKGVAFNSRFMYVGAEDTVYCYTRDFALVNVRQMPNTIAAVDTVPLAPDYPADADYEYELSYHPEQPVVLYHPVLGDGFCQILPIDLDPAATVEDVEYPNIPKIRRVNDVPDLEPDTNPLDDDVPQWLVNQVYDMHVDRFQNIWISCGLVPWPGALSPGMLPTEQTYYVALLTFQTPSYVQTHNASGTGAIPDLVFSDGEDDVGYQLREILPPAIGTQDVLGLNLALFSFDSYLPMDVTDLSFDSFWTTAGVTLGYEYVSAGLTITADPYTADLWEYVFNSRCQGIMGYGPGSALGFFEQANVRNFDPDTDDGGPSGIFIDDLDERAYVCDPENGRIQIFNSSFPYAVIDQIGGLAEPSRIRVDDDGIIWISDVNTLYSSLGVPDAGYGGAVINVTDWETNYPIANATVQISQPYGTPLRWEPAGQTTLLTNINGQVQVENLKVGVYTASANQIGYQNVDSTQLQIIKDQIVEINFNLLPQYHDPLGAVIGRVIDEYTGLPLMDVEVRLKVPGTGYGQGVIMTGTTDNFGKFVIRFVDPGEYDVEFEYIDPDPLAPQRFQIIVKENVQVFAGSRYDLSDVFLPRV